MILFPEIGGHALNYEQEYYGLAILHSKEPLKRWTCFGIKVDYPQNSHSGILTYCCDLLGKRIVFVTNNSTKSRADYRKKLDGLGIKAGIVCPAPLYMDKRQMLT